MTTGVMMILSNSAHHRPELVMKNTTHSPSVDIHILQNSPQLLYLALMNDGVHTFRLDGGRFPSDATKSQIII